MVPRVRQCTTHQGAGQFFVCQYALKSWSDVSNCEKAVTPFLSKNLHCSCWSKHKLDISMRLSRWWLNFNILCEHLLEVLVCNNNNKTNESRATWLIMCVNDVKRKKVGCVFNNSTSVYCFHSRTDKSSRQSLLHGVKVLLILLILLLEIIYLQASYWLWSHTEKWEEQWWVYLQQRVG